MFGLIHALFSLTGATISGLKGAAQNETNRSHGRQRDIGKAVKKNTYIDRRGVERSLRDDSIVTTTRDYATGDIVQKNMYGDVIRNLSEEQRQIDFANASAAPNGRTTFLYKRSAVTFPMIRDRDYKGIRAVGDQYKDYETGRLFQCRLIPIGEWEGPDNFRIYEKGTRSRRGQMLKFYMYNGLIVRLADEAPTHQIPKKTINEFIQRFNKAQRENGWLGMGRPNPRETNLVKIYDVSNAYYLNDFAARDD